MNATQNKNASSQPTATVADRFPQFAGLRGKELLRAGIRAQLSRQKENGSLPNVRVSSE